MTGIKEESPLSVTLIEVDEFGTRREKYSIRVPATEKGLELAKLFIEIIRPVQDTSLAKSEGEKQ
jgi:hypothetical protein